MSRRNQSSLCPGSSPPPDGLLAPGLPTFSGAHSARPVGPLRHLIRVTLCCQGLSSLAEPRPLSAMSPQGRACSDAHSPGFQPTADAQGVTEAAVLSGMARPRSHGPTTACLPRDPISEGQQENGRGEARVAEGQVPDRGGTRCYGLNFALPDSHAEALTPTWLHLETGPLRRRGRLAGHAVDPDPQRRCLVRDKDERKPAICHVRTWGRAAVCRPRTGLDHEPNRLAHWSPTSGPRLRPPRL